MAAVKSITSPMKFLIQAGLLADLGKHIKQYGDAGLIICDPFIAEKAAADSKASLAEHGVKGVFTVFGGESSDEEINRQQAEFDQAGCRFVVGIGGGKKRLQCGHGASAGGLVVFDHQFNARASQCALQRRQAVGVCAGAIVANRELEPRGTQLRGVDQSLVQSALVQRAIGQPQRGRAGVHRSHACVTHGSGNQRDFCIGVNE